MIGCVCVCDCVCNAVCNALCVFVVLCVFTFCMFVHVAVSECACVLHAYDFWCVVVYDFWCLVVQDILCVCMWGHWLVWRLANIFVRCVVGFVCSKKCGWKRGFLQISF